MSDLNWCTFCDKAIGMSSNSLYCSEECLRSDALNHHPLLGYDYAELKDFPRSTPTTSPALSFSSSVNTLPVHSPTLSYQLPSPRRDDSTRWSSPPLFELDDVKRPRSAAFFI